MFHEPYTGFRSLSSWSGIALPEDMQHLVWSFPIRTSHLFIHPLHLQRNTYKDLSLELVPTNLTIRYFRFLELFLTYMRI
jgi:hypothetical protein